MHPVTHCVLFITKSKSILDVRARLTNEWEAVSYSLFVITTVTGKPPISEEATAFPLPVKGHAHLHGMFAHSKSDHEIQSLGKVESFSRP